MRNPNIEQQLDQMLHPQDHQDRVYLTAENLKLLKNCCVVLQGITYGCNEQSVRLPTSPKPKPRPEKVETDSQTSSIRLVAVHVSEKERSPNRCEYCSLQLKNAEQLITHLKLCLVRPDRFSCQICGRAFSSKQKLKKHEAKAQCKYEAYEMEGTGQKVDQKAKLEKLAQVKDKKPIKPQSLSFNFLKNPEKLIVTPKPIITNPARSSVHKAKNHASKPKKNVEFRLPGEKRSPNKTLPSPPQKTKPAEAKNKKIVNSQPPSFSAFDMTKSSHESYFVQALIPEAASGIENEWTPVRYSPQKALVKSEIPDPIVVPRFSPFDVNGLGLVTNSNELKCAECGVNCADIALLEKHVRNAKHESLNNNIIRLCSDKNKEEFQCKFCSKIYPHYKLNKAKFHAFLHVYPEFVRQMFEKQVFNCKRRKCGATFNDARALEQHEKLEHSDLVKKASFKCQYCDQVFATLPGCKLHEKEIHAYSDM